jgi:hypothetical protein
MALVALAGTLMQTGHQEEAEPLLGRSLAIRVKAIGRDHPDVSAVLNSLALLYKSDGRAALVAPRQLRPSNRQSAEGAFDPEAVLRHCSQ